MGYLVFRDISDADLLDLHRESGRVLLTRDTRLIRSPRVAGYLLVQGDHWETQLKQVLGCLNLPIAEGRIMTRCPICNHSLRRGSHDEARGRVPDYVISTCRDFQECDPSSDR